MDDKAMAFLRSPLELDLRIFSFIENACLHFEKQHGISRAIFVSALLLLGFAARDVADFALQLKIGVPLHICLIVYPFALALVFIVILIFVKIWQRFSKIDPSDENMRIVRFWMSIFAIIILIACGFSILLFHILNFTFLFYMFFIANHALCGIFLSEGIYALAIKPA